MEGGGVRPAKKQGVEMAWRRTGVRVAQLPVWAESRLQVTRLKLRKLELRMTKTMGAYVVMWGNPKPPPGQKLSQPRGRAMSYSLCIQSLAGGHAHSWCLLLNAG